MDKQTFTDKILQSEQTLYRISMSILKNETDCEDAVQDTILTAYSKLGSLRNEEYFKTWLVRILINTCNKAVKRKRRFVSSDDVAESSVPDSAVGTEVRLAIENLKPKIRIVVVMKYIEGFSVKEIKDILKIPEGTVKSRLAEGRRQLGIELAEKTSSKGFTDGKLELL